MGKIVTGGDHAVDAAQVATVSKGGVVASPSQPPTCLLELHILSGVPTAFLSFDNADTRDAFFKELVSAMGG